MNKPPRVLIEEWLPAAALGVECMRERGNASALAPHTFLHVWWARRPLTVSRAAILGSLLPVDFPKDVFERLLGFWGTSEQILEAQAKLDYAKLYNQKINNPHGTRAFKSRVSEKDLLSAHTTARKLWGPDIIVMDPMAGGGSIPLETVRLGFAVKANEYNPVACSVLEATVDYPFRFGMELMLRARHWGGIWRERFNTRVARFFPQSGNLPPHCYLFARTVPCPDTQFPTPLVPDWHLRKPKNGRHLVAEPINVNKNTGEWSIRTCFIGSHAGELREPPKPTYNNGKGISLFTGSPIDSGYIKAKAQAGEMGSILYAIAYKTPQRLEFLPPEPIDLKAIEAAEAELNRLRPDWEKRNIIPTEEYPIVSSDERPRLYGMPRWADMFSSRQLLCMGTLVEELQKLRLEIIKSDGEELGEAVVHLLAQIIDKYCDYNSKQAIWHPYREVIAHTFKVHAFPFHPANAEMAPCNSGSGFAWAIANVLDSYEDLAKLSRSSDLRSIEISLGSSTNLSNVPSGSVHAVVVDPPYDDNVQYSELANFFYVWLKRTQGHRRPEWFSTYLCEHSQEAVVNASRFLTENGNRPGKRERGESVAAKVKSRDFYRQVMTDTFKECRRILRDDGVLTVMFTHKKQEAWEALFTALIKAGFTITATWPVKTESEHSLHQARKNAAQSTVLLVARKRPPGVGKGYFDSAMREEIHRKARTTATRLEKEGLKRVDQLVGSFGPAMEVYSRYDEVVTDTGEPVGVDLAIDEASEAVSAWRIEELANAGLEGVEPEGRFALLCWDVLQAAEFRYNEAHLLGKAVGMDVDQLIGAGLVRKEGDKVFVLPVRERRRERSLEPDEVMETLFGPITTGKRRTKKAALKVHPNDPQFRTALDACHAVALTYLEAASESAGIGSARSLARKQGWNRDSKEAKLMEALVHAAPDAVKFIKKGKNIVAEKFPEFRAWHSLLKPLFDIEPPEWKEPPPPLTLTLDSEDEASEEEDLENNEVEE